MLVFLEAEVPLTKKYVKTKAGVTKTPYPFVWEFTSHKEDPATLQQFEAKLRAHAAKGHCLLKGTIHRDLVKESRAGSTDTNSPTDWVCLDFDGVDSLTSVNDAMTLLGLKDVSHIVQYSASSGVDGDQSLRAHVFMLLDKPTSAPLLKQWLIHLNHTVPEFRAAMKLTKTGNSIRWPLDISACQNDKLLYIAAPTLQGLADPFAGKPRITLVKRKHDRLSIQGTFSTEKNRALTDKRIAELREAEGLPKRSFKTKMHGSVEILVKPDSAMITEMKTERGFVYFNLNGGDSWAYYHPENNPEFIFNFKGEPTYLTKELLPDYWQQITNSATKTSSNGLMYLAFCDRKSSAYWRGTYDAKTDTLEIHQAKNETQVRHFAKQHGMPLGDFIPEWDLTFDPQDSATRVDVTNRVVNTFQPSEFMKSTGLKATSKIPPTILKVMNHALGGDPDVLEHFVNWLAFIVQERDRTGTSWVLHGTEGTGKGILCNDIIRPILGATNTVMKRMEELSEQFNAYMRGALMVVVDEVQTSALQNEEGVMAKVRNFITEPYVPVRAMHATAVEHRNFTNWIFNSNKPDPVLIPKSDRRTNVARYQPTPLKAIFPNETIPDVKARIAKELTAFFSFLLFYPCDEIKAATPIETEDRKTMISIGESSIDTVSSAILEGSFEFLMDQLPSGHNYADNSLSAMRLDNYKHCLAALIQRTDPKNGKCNISREELRMLFEFVIGNMPATPNKFTSLLKHHRIHIEKVWINNATASGIRTIWNDLASFPAWLAMLQPRQAAKAVTAAAPAKKPAVKAAKAKTP